MNGVDFSTNNAHGVQNLSLHIEVLFFIINISPFDGADI